MIFNTPLEMIVPPLYPLAPERVKVPPPSSVTTVPSTAPLSVML